MKRLKNILFTFLFFWLTFSAFSQNKGSSYLSFGFDRIDIGKSFSLNYLYGLNERWTVKGGLNYHANVLPSDDGNYVFHKRGWAANWHEHFGLNLEVRYNIVYNKYFTGYLGYNLHFFHLSFRDHLYVPIANPGRPGSFFDLVDGNITGPATILDHGLVFGFNTNFTEKVGFNVTVGPGIASYYGYTEEVDKSNFFRFLGTDLNSVSLKYSFAVYCRLN